MGVKSSVQEDLVKLKERQEMGGTVLQYGILRFNEPMRVSPKSDPRSLDERNR
jgi:hypothetical protein